MNIRVIPESEAVDVRSFAVFVDSTFIGSVSQSQLPDRLSHLAPLVSASNNRHVTKAEIAAYFGVGERTVNRWMLDGMPFDREGARKVLFKIGPCREWAESSGVALSSNP